MTVSTLERPEAPAQTEQRYSSAVACRAAGISMDTLKNWLSRKPAVVLLSDVERREAGEARRFSFDRRRVLQIAVTAELVALGLAPRRATMAAAAFTDSGHGASTRLPARNPGDLYPGSQTWLVVPQEPNPAKVVPVGPTTAAAEILSPEYGPRYVGAVVVRLDDIVATVDAVLATAE